MNNARTSADFTYLPHEIRDDDPPGNFKKMLAERAFLPRAVTKERTRSLHTCYQVSRRAIVVSLCKARDNATGVTVQRLNAKKEEI